MGTYTFPVEKAGTYMYHSGTDPALQVEMGLLGAIVVRPYGYDPNNPTAYGHPDTAFDREYLFVLSEMDSRNSASSLTRFTNAARPAAALSG